MKKVFLLSKKELELLNDIMFVLYQDSNAF